MSAVAFSDRSAPVAERRLPWLIGVGSLGLLVYGTFGLAPDAVAGWYVPMNIATATVLVFVAGRFGVGYTGIGFTEWRSGVRWGSAVAAAIAAGLALAVAIPSLRPFLEDGRLAGVGTVGYLYRGLIRIPFGTALLEEVAFRGVLFGAWRRRSGPVIAAVGSSVVFGLWHIRPTMDLLAANDITAAPVIAVALIAAAVVFTFFAGLFFCYLRVRSGSLVAPFFAHAAVNSLATAAVWAATSIGA